MTGIARPLAIPPVLIRRSLFCIFRWLSPPTMPPRILATAWLAFLSRNSIQRVAEVLLVDDCSTDATHDIASGIAHSHGNLRVMSTLKKSGPGIARNIGVSQVRGRWIIFLDSDDTLASNLLRHLKEFIDTQTGDLDAVGYNWSFASADHGNSSLPPAGRRDQAALGLNRTDLLKKYLCLHMDGSVIYTAVRRELITHNHLCFAEGYHEDVDYIFMSVLEHVRRVGYLDEVLYYKGWRSGLHHQHHFPPACTGIHARPGHGSPPSFKRTMKALNSVQFWSTGRDCVGALLPGSEKYTAEPALPAQATELGSTNCSYECLGKEFGSSPIEADEIPTSQYGQITANFLTVMQDRNLSSLQKGAAISRFIEEADAKSWSYIDLHHLAFLPRPDTDVLQTLLRGSASAR